MKMFDCFRDLLVFGEDIGMVDKAHMYNDDYCTVEGIDTEGNKFLLSLNFNRIPLCEKINEEDKEND